MQFKDLAEEMSKVSPVKLTGEVVERKGKKDRAIKTFMLVAQGNPRRAIYRKNLRVDGAAFLTWLRCARGPYPSRGAFSSPQ